MIPSSTYPLHLKLYRRIIRSKLECQNQSECAHPDDSQTTSLIANDNANQMSAEKQIS